MLTVPAQIFCAPTRAKLIAALRSMPGVCGVFGSSEWPGITRTPSCFHFEGIDELQARIPRLTRAIECQRVPEVGASCLHCASRDPGCRFRPPDIADFHD